MKRTDYVVDGGDGGEVICRTLREAKKVAADLSRKQKRGIYIYRWYKGSCDDMEMDDNWCSYVERAPIE